MKLRFLGNSYQCESNTLDIIELESTGKFRGANYQLHSPIVTKISTQRHLKYRGVMY